MPDVAGLPRSTYYYYTRKQKDPDKYAELKEEICSIVTEHKGRYGYRRVTQELQNRGFHHNHKLVMKLMKKLGLTSKVRMKKYHSYKGEVGKIAPNLLDRDFYAEQPDQKWVTDVTEFSLFGEKLYLSPILDLCSEDLVSYTISEHPMLSMVTSMLEKAFDTIPDCALPGFVDSKNEEKTERNAGYLVVSHSGGGMLRQGTRKGIRRTPANRGMRAHRIVKSLDISEDVCHGLCP